jgi:hypothetical protein
MRLGGPKGQKDNVKMEQQTAREPPSSEASAWPTRTGISGVSTVGSGQSNSSPFLQGSVIWNSEARRRSLSRLSEVSPSGRTSAGTPQLYEHQDRWKAINSAVCHSHECQDG